MVCEVCKIRRCPAVDALLGLIPGAGQLYNGKNKKALFFSIGLILSSLLIFVGIGVITTPALALVSCYDSWHNAVRINRATG